MMSAQYKGEMPIASENLPLPRRSELYKKAIAPLLRRTRKKLAAVTMVFKKNVLIFKTDWFELELLLLID